MHRCAIYSVSKKRASFDKHGLMLMNLAIMARFIDTQCVLLRKDKNKHREHGTNVAAVRFNGHFPGGPRLASTRTSPVLDFTGAKDDGDGGDNWRYKTSQSRNEDLDMRLMR